MSFFYLISFSMPKVISTLSSFSENDSTVFIGHINAYFDYVLSLGHIFTNICIIAYFLVIFRLIFNIPLYIVHRIITQNLGSDFYDLKTRNIIFVKSLIKSILIIIFLAMLIFRSYFGNF